MLEKRSSSNHSFFFGQKNVEQGKALLFLAGMDMEMGGYLAQGPSNRIMREGRS